jgi:cytochrome c-type biogenesis protein CcmH/NrfF
MRRASAVMLLFFLLASAPATAAASPAEITQRVADRVLSPFCPGLTLSACPSRQATQLRARIEEWARHGLGEKGIMLRLENQYGPRIRAVPPPRGNGLVAWLVPGLSLVAGAGLLLSTMRRLTRRAPAGGRPVPPAGRERVEEELARARARTEGRP